MTQTPPSSPQDEHEDLYELVYDELRKIAASKMANEAPLATLQATALVHEVWLRLGGDRQPRWESKSRFYRCAARAMQRILIDRARKKKRQRRGGDFVRAEVDDLDSLAKEEEAEQQLLAIDEALDELSEHHPEKAELVKLRFFAGLTLKEVGDALNISERTAKRWWSFAKAWLYDKVSN